MRSEAFATSNPVGEEVIMVEEELAETNHVTFFNTAYFLQCLTTLSSLIFNLAVAVVQRLMETLGRLWNNYNPPEVFWEEADIMPRPSLTFIISGLIGFAEIKAQGQAGFPFQTHPQAIMVSVTSLLMYGLASLAELVISGAHFDPTSIYAIIARLGRIGSLCSLVISLSILFYF